MQIDDLAPLLGVDSADFINLQHGRPGREFAANSSKVISLLTDELSLDDYAAAIAATDLLITVDTMAAHLAGTLQHPAWIALPFSPQWTWGLTSEVTPWYPTARLFRQQSRGQWSVVIANLTQRLDQFANERASNTRPIAVVPIDISSADQRQDPQPMPEAVEQADKRLALALKQFQQGDWKDGFANYEARLSDDRWIGQALPLRESLFAAGVRRLEPGEAVNGRRIAVFTEQGLGDTFLSARFLNTLAQRGAAITLICRAPMRQIFSRLPYVDEILSPPEDAPHAKIDLRKLQFDAFCPLLSLPHALGIAPDTIASPEPYLSADPAQTKSWKSRYCRQAPGDNLKVGLVWRANPGNTALAKRSLDIEDLAILGDCDGVDFVNLQHGAEARQLARILPNSIDPMSAPLTLDEFTAALAATDLVISIDTMAAHCAGALGHNVFVILPADSGWWWGPNPSNCIWYPSARLFRTSSKLSEGIKASASALHEMCEQRAR
jgi:ADP-heptose:LPS heptosyltransferase